MTDQTTTKPRKPSLRWRRLKAPTGLARVCWTHYDDRELTYGGEVMAHVCEKRDRMGRGELLGWYWHGGIGADHMNTCNALTATREECQEACIAWIRAKLAEAK